MYSNQNESQIKPIKKKGNKNLKDNILVTNLNLIKSKYILKYIFSFLAEKRGLMLIYYNKQYRNKFSYDQKKISGKYIEVEKDGYGRIFSNKSKKVIYKGYFKNFKKNGEGKEYNENDNSIKFEGKYLNGKRYEGIGYDNNGNVVMKIEKGKIKEYYKNGKLQFKGEYYNNKRWTGKGYNHLGFKEYELNCGKGNVKEYDYDGNLIFEGKYFNGERNGKGKEFFSNRIKFEGEYLNGLRNGKGKEYYLNGNVKYEGEFLNGLRNGNGKGYNYFNGNIIFEGEYLIGERKNFY